tara:strand:- start:3631 stop:4041 length:411 start_codon:yes stop_codon:yes gene_type:complete
MIMAYVSQEMKKEFAPAIKAVLKKYNMKGSIAVRHHSVLVVNIKSGALDILGSLPVSEYGPRDYIQVNEHWIKENYDDATVVAFLTELKDAMKGPDFFDESDAMTDYFHVSHYLSMNVGNYNTPYIYTPLELKKAA